MADSDPEAALLWITEHFRAEAAQNLASVVVNKISKTDPRVAVEMAYDLPANNATNSLRGNVLRAWVSAEGSAEQAEKWIRQIEDPKVRNSAYHQIGLGWVRTDREAAIAYAADAPDSQIEDGFIEAVAGALDNKDYPMDVKGWITDLPQDRAAVAARTYIRDISFNEPLEGAELARSFADPVVRESALQASAKRFLDRDPAGLARWFTSLDVETANIVMAEVDRIDPTSRTDDRQKFDAALLNR